MKARRVRKPKSGHKTAWEQTLFREQGVTTSQGKFKSKKVWLSDGSPVLYQTVDGKKTRIDRAGDEVVDSVKEWKRFKLLEILERQGKISDLRRQVPFEILKGFRYNGETLRKRQYKADFVYKENGITIIEDVKSKHTRTLPEYRFKRHIILEKYVVPHDDVEFREVV